MTEGPKPLSRNALFRQVGPLVGAVMLWLLYESAKEVAPDAAAALVKGVALTGFAAVAVVLVPWRRLPRTLMVIPPLLYLTAAVVLRESWGGVFPGVVLVLPVLWLAMYATEVELGIGIVALAAAGATGPGGPVVLAAGTAAAIAVYLVFEALRSGAGGLERVVRLDPLTGVANRWAWDSALARMPKRLTAPASLVLLDLDLFSTYLDDHGRQAADRLLKEAAAFWADELRHGDLLARLEEDVFAILLPRCPLPAARGIAERLRHAVPDGLTCSAGVACWDGLESSAKLFVRADRALYRAKVTGRDRVEADIERSLVPAGRV